MALAPDAEALFRAGPLGVVGKTEELIAILRRSKSLLGRIELVDAQQAEQHHVADRLVHQ